MRNYTTEQYYNYVVLNNYRRIKMKVYFKVRRDETWDEYEVMVIDPVTGNKIPERSYFTDDSQDAIDTFNAMVKEEEKRCEDCEAPDKSYLSKYCLECELDVCPPDNFETEKTKRGTQGIDKNGNQFNAYEAYCQGLISPNELKEAVEKYYK